MRKKLLLIINPRSGINKINDDLMDATAVFGAHGYDITIMHTSKTGDATDFAREHGSDYDIVVCRGGDGTFCEMMNGIMTLEKQPRIGYLPAGTTPSVCPQDSPQKRHSLSSKKKLCPMTSASSTEDILHMLHPSVLLPNAPMQPPRALKTKSADLHIFMRRQRKSRTSIQFPSAALLTERFLRMNLFSAQFPIPTPLAR